MQFELYGFDLQKEAEMKPSNQLSAAAQAALERYSSLPQENTSWRQQTQYKQKELTQEQRQKQYFEIKEQQMTRELQTELQAIQLRNTTHKQAQEQQQLDPKVVVGTVIEGPAQFYSQRIPKKQRKQSMVDQVLRMDDKIEEKLKQIDQQRHEERVARMKMRNRRGKK